jgi:hypothetical protein
MRDRRTRRQFLNTTGASLAAFAGAPALTGSAQATQAPAAQAPAAIPIWWS